MIRADVVVRRGEFTLDASMSAAAGETVAILGPNGAGKTTLLRALAGLEPLAEGVVEVGDRVLEDVIRGVRVVPEQRRIGVVFQDYRLFPHLSVRENVAFGMRARGATRRDAVRRADALLEDFGLGGLGAQRPDQLSGGQAQRVAVARALVADPILLLLDEPLAALDVAVRDEVRSLLRRAIGTFGGPALLVTHDPLEALTFGDQIVVLENGRVVQRTTPQDLVRRPATPYVARLVGLNFWRGSVVAGFFHADDGGEIGCAAAGLAGRAIAILRPSALGLHRVEPVSAPTRTVFEGLVCSVEPAGERVRIAVGSTPPVFAEITAETMAALRIATGDRVWASAASADVETYAEPSPVSQPPIADMDRAGCRKSGSSIP